MDYLYQMASKYKLPIGFVTDFYDKVTDKQNFEYGLKMFVDGLMDYDTATGANSVNIAQCQLKVLDSIVKRQSNGK